jgi:hypothetical protein
MNQDYLQRFPNQNIELRSTECVGETVADIVGNIVGVPCDAGYSFAATLRVMGVTPTTAGSDPYSGALSGIVYGALPTVKEPFDATTMGELYEANLDNYPVPDKQAAEQYAQNGIVLLESYTDIVNFLSLNKGGVILPMRWYQSFMTPNPDGTLPMPSGGITDHCVAVYEATTLGLRVKPWLGANYGTGGYCYMPEALFPTLFFGEAWGFDKSRSRWFSLASASVMRPWIIKDTLPQMIPLL